MLSFEPTSEQNKIVNASIKNRIMKVVAFAGAGKTATMTLIAEALCEKNMQGLYLTFNRDIANDAKKKMPKGVDVRTFHSLALKNTDREISKKLNLPKALFPRNFKNDFAIKSFYVTADSSKYNPNGSNYKKIEIDSYKQYNLIIKAMELFLMDMSVLPQDFHIHKICEDVLCAYLTSADKNIIANNLLPIMYKLWKRFKNPNDDYQISHRVYLKIWALSNPTIEVDFILFDEAQDSDSLMFQILSQQKTKVIYVGDPHQQIYEFRGAINAMQNINAPTYYLTKSFRFGEEIASYAGNILKYLGESKTMRGIDKPSNVDITTQYPKDIDVILTRTNFGAIEAVVEHTVHNNNRSVIPKNIKLEWTLALLADIERFRVATNDKKIRRHRLLGNFKDYDDLQNFCENSPNDTTIGPTVKLYNKYGYEEIVRILQRASKESLTSKNKTVVTTSHKSKGLEWNNVMLWHDFQGSMKHDEIEEYLESNGVVDPAKGKPIGDGEARLLYVSMTRAKNKLYAYHVNKLIDYIKLNPHRDK